MWGVGFSGFLVGGFEGLGLGFAEFGGSRFEVWVGVLGVGVCV